MSKKIQTLFFNEINGKTNLSEWITSCLLGERKVTSERRMMATALIIRGPRNVNLLIHHASTQWRWSSAGGGRHSPQSQNQRGARRGGHRYPLENIFVPPPPVAPTIALNSIALNCLYNF